MLEKKIAIIGAGNMGAALLRGILRAKLIPPGDITIVDVHTQKLESLRSQYGVRATAEPTWCFSR